MKGLTVGELRRLLAGLPDDADIRPDWKDGPPGDKDPAVILHGFTMRHDKKRCYLSVLVGIQYLDEFGVVWHHADGRMAKIKKRDF